MILNKREIPNNSAEQVVDYIASALSLLEQLEPPDDLRVAVFNQAVALYSGKQIVVEQLAQSPNGLALP